MLQLCEDIRLSCRFPAWRACRAPKKDNLSYATIRLSPLIMAMVATAAATIMRIVVVRECAYICVRTCPTVRLHTCILQLETLQVCYCYVCYNLRFSRPTCGCLWTRFEHATISARGWWILSELARLDVEIANLRRWIDEALSKWVSAVAVGVLSDG